MKRCIVAKRECWRGTEAPMLRGGRCCKSANAAIQLLIFPSLQNLLCLSIVVTHHYSESTLLSRMARTFSCLE